MGIGLTLNATRDKVPLSTKVHLITRKSHFEGQLVHSGFLFKFYPQPTVTGINLRYVSDPSNAASICI